MKRRHFLAAGGACLANALRARPMPPAPPVAIAKCGRYDATEIHAALKTAFDQIGGLGRLVKGRTVTIKINAVQDAARRIGHAPNEETMWTHPLVAGATVSLMDRAGARRIRVVEGVWHGDGPLEEHLLTAHWDPSLVLGAGSNVTMVNCNVLGRAKRYPRFTVPGGGMVFPAYDLHPVFEECDTFVSLTKLKEHITTGVSLTMKNCFGSTPASIYGDSAGEDEPNEYPTLGRNKICHKGSRQPPGSSPREIDTSSPRHAGYRIPRIITDLVAARPVDLAIIDGVQGLAMGEGWWVRRARPVRVGALIAGTNPVCADAVGASVMGYDPMADHRTGAFAKRPPHNGAVENMMALAAANGLGSHDLRQIEVRGAPISEVATEFSRLRETV